MLQLKGALAGRRAAGAGGPAAGDGRGQRRAVHAGCDRGLGGDQVLACARRRRRPASSRCAPAAADLVLQLKEAPAGAELVEQVGSSW
ncbi:hypothetical protein LJR269_006618 [Duganella sp. LjRoot269]